MGERSHARAGIRQRVAALRRADRARAWLPRGHARHALLPGARLLSAARLPSLRCAGRLSARPSEALLAEIAGMIGKLLTQPIAFALAPYEIRTFKLWFGQDLR